jgi:hypothetical protein
MDTPNPKCSKCKCYWKPDELDVKTSGLVFRTCNKCRNRNKISKEINKCEHGRIKSICKECRGSSICEHGRIKSQCKECGGSSFCEHGRIKSTCKECGGSSICEHGTRRSTCKECGGSSFCEHGRIKSTCKECGGSSICEHGRIKSQCKECGGSSICEHGIRRSTCKECDKSLYLIHLQRCHIYRCFKKSQLNKNLHSIEYLGIDTEDFINFFEMKMNIYNEYNEEKMTWENIHIDHIKPVSKFNLDDEEEFLDCCNYTNLQPLLATDNLEKSNKWSDVNEKYWQENIRGNSEHFDIYLVE